jgi:hypothetical protein
LLDCFFFIEMLFEPLWIGLFFFLSSSRAISLTILVLSSERTLEIQSLMFALHLSENF